MGQSEGKGLTWVAPDVAAGAQGKGQCLRACEEPLPLSLSVIPWPLQGKASKQGGQEETEKGLGSGLSQL